MFNIDTLIKKYKTKIYDDKIYFYPNIPTRKLKNAIKKYADIDLESEDVLMLIDDTVLGSAKAGLVLTDEAIYIKDSNSDGFSCLLEDIHNVSFKNYLLVQKLVINHTLSISFTQPKKVSLALVADMLQEINNLEEIESSNWSSIGIGVGVGALFGGPIGAAIGAAIGASMDKKDSSTSTYNEDMEEDKKNELLFVATLASLLAKMAKADGIITQDEADTVSDIFDKLEFDGNLREVAISAFKHAKSDEYSIYDYANQYLKLSDMELREFMYSILWDIAIADGELVKEEKNILINITENLGLSSSKFNEYYNQYFDEETQQSEDDTLSLEESYIILNSTPTNTLKEVKIEYRKLVSEYHPDRIHSKGLPESFVKFATEQLQKINLAYEIVQTNY